jgi:Kef-type K+ transport system membrane component KefB
VLTCAASSPKVIGFVLSTIIRTLGETSPPSAIAPWSVAQPLVTSFLYITLAIPVVRFGFAPLYRRYIHVRLMDHPERPKLALLGVIGGLSLGVAITGLIGSSPLLGVYLIGLSLTYLPPPAKAATGEALRSHENTPAPSVHAKVHPFHEAFETYLLPLQTWFFSPLFFSSIGFVLPLRRPSKLAGLTRRRPCQDGHPLHRPLVGPHHLEGRRLRRPDARRQAHLRLLDPLLGSL